jgi:hypothetical protein
MEVRVGGREGEGATRFSVLVTPFSLASVTTIDGREAKPAVPKLASGIVSAPSVCPINAGVPGRVIGLSVNEFSVVV